ncbi:MAG: 5'/3'-nucleotidase SurE [Spirochaetes bacterium]|nr:5'/3'-nucleotidase SurE [Spirochaetota bacterium]
MTILLTNDDGINAEGLQALHYALSQEHDVFVVAPTEERSACSNAITVRTNIAVHTIHERQFAVDGYTADCVNIGLNGGFIPPVDIVIAGINHGPNLGDDVYFSGTVAGARTACIFGIHGIAVSLDCLTSSSYFSEAAQFVLHFISDITRYRSRLPFFFNINYPNIPSHEIKGIKYTTLGRRKYNDTYLLHNENNSSKIVQLSGSIESIGLDNTDVFELRNGYISITPLSLDCTDHEFLRIIR